VALWTPSTHASGFLIDAKGLIATNQRVIGTATSVEVQLSPDDSRDAEASGGLLDDGCPRRRADTGCLPAPDQARQVRLFADARLLRRRRGDAHPPVQARTARLRERCDLRRSTRFGTEGSEDQILSPRPISRFSSENPQTLAWRVTRFFLQLRGSGTEWPVTQIQPPVGIVRDFSPPCSRPVHSPNFLKQSATLDATRRRVGTLIHDADD
jgi:hypothetical protein